MRLDPPVSVDSAACAAPPPPGWDLSLVGTFFDFQSPPPLHGVVFPLGTFVVAHLPSSPTAFSPIGWRPSKGLNRKHIRPIWIY